jgi:hypothetical protein
MSIEPEKEIVLTIVYGPRVDRILDEIVRAAGRPARLLCAAQSNAAHARVKTRAASGCGARPRLGTMALRRIEFPCRRSSHWPT